MKRLSIAKACLILATWMVAGATALWPYVYTNEVDGAGVITRMAISNMTNKVYLNQSRRYQVEDPTSSAAAKDFNADYPIYFMDISRGLEARHQALGFMDVMVCLVTEPPSKTWRMLGDSDQRNDNDFRAIDGDGILYDFIDTNYKANYLNTTYDSGLVRMTTTNLAANSYVAKGGEYVVMRFAVPRWETTSYGLFLGRNIKLGSTSGLEASETAKSYQVQLYTPKLTNRLIPWPAVVSPSVDGIWDSIYDPATRVRGIATKTVTLPKGVPVVFGADRSINLTGSPITNWEWNFGDGLIQTSAPTVTRTFSNTGNFLLWLRVTAGGIQAATSGLVTDTNGFNPGGISPLQPDTMPSALPFAFRVADPPTNQVMGHVRPSPFIPRQHHTAWVDFRTDRETFVNLQIVTLEGNPVKSLTSQKYPAGFWSVPWDGRDSLGYYVGEGLYYAALETPYGKEAKKVMVVRLK